ncbi:hypothetical protein [Streptomyces clavuligerus]|uniref:Uncharacterized protein n=1 Tax=Streptomyces clavuligerus TaxID=1901 RepID=B5GVQ7_STRCL|nr:hypothetical protein [Streptomyces clavuligerus]EDY50403.1 hypothetical protein SSCG_03550 [Streptomyces clavuligerus]EFG03552.1 Hypothetical protein SCLAV_p0057 [Streptomyces clavuligerus]MBY6307866.1 hypothetical protein [Streptomyces clavuligerus]QCS09580.1 hypothetical protein CRV15_28420 [Streptomyces clavuligerus]QPJ98368.1 hypothetical protein GE265_35885 [Streptomyces clavuligerus]
MSTPGSGNLQTSSQHANQLGHNALQQAESGIKRSQQDVRTTMDGLIRAYGGKDGGAFQNLLNEWSGQVDQITARMAEMMEALRNTGLAQNRTQNEIEELITAAKNQHAHLGDAAYGTLMGGK